MDKLFLVVLFFCSICFSCGQKELKENWLSYIDTRVGTSVSITQHAGLFGKNSEEYGQTIPAVLVPHGMNFWTPQTQDTEQKCIAPYYYRDSLMQGFRNSHWLVGGCAQDYGSMTLMPGWGSLRCRPQDRGAFFSHENEVATPAYYSCFLEPYKIHAEMTATSRSAIFQFTYMKEGDGFLIVNPNSDEGEGYIEIDPNKNEIRGYNPVHRIYQGWGEKAGFNGYFVLKFDCEIQDYGVYKDTLLFQQKKSIGNNINIGAYVRFKVQKNETIKVKVGSSFSSMEGAILNLNTEIPHWDFNRIRKQLENIWNKELNRINIFTDTLNKQKFYSALYRTSFLPRTFNDVDGSHPAFGSNNVILKGTSDKDYFDDFSAWDTYRALHPLKVLIDSERSAQMIQSLIEKYKQGGWLPIFPCWNSYTAAMIGDHCTAIIADAYIKGIKDFDIETAYSAMKKNAFTLPNYQDYQNGMGRRALKSYMKYGYIPLEDSVKDAFHTCEQVSRTLEYAYDDFALAQVALRLQKNDDYKILMQRAKGYKEVIDSLSGYALGRYSNGKFMVEKKPFEFVKYITEGAPCHYTWYVPHDIYGLIRHLGGKEVFTSKLDSMFSENRYWHGNEPCHHIPYLFNYVGQPWKTQKYVREILTSEYLQAPGGLSGNDDAGQMSAWYVFSAMGFYPVCPASPYYMIGTPLFEKTVLNLENSKQFVILAKNVSSKNKYIYAVKLNGKSYLKNYLNHSDILRGGILEIYMSDKPNKLWGSSVESCPPSMFN